MNVKSLLLLVLSGLAQISVCQVPVIVTESTLKIPALSEEVFYHAFAEGDRMIFSFQEVNGKELKEVEITEWPSSSKFMDYKTKSIPEKMLEVASQAVYKFRFSNTSLAGRVCKIVIKRIPANPAREKFNTTVYWHTVYDTLRTPVTENYLEKSDTVIQHIVDNVSKVSSQNAINGKPNRTVMDFYLPENTIAWSYYIGTGNEGREAFEKSKDDFVGVAAKTISTIPQYGPMAALALYGINLFSKIQGGDNVTYYFITDAENAQQFMSGLSFLQYKQGDVINDASQMKAPLTGKLFLGLVNDNVMQPIEVIIKVTAVQVTQKWGKRTVDQITLTPRQEPFAK
jgi:hypothetical protein